MLRALSTTMMKMMMRPHDKASMARNTGSYARSVTQNVSFFSAGASLPSSMTCSSPFVHSFVPSGSLRSVSTKSTYKMKPPSRFKQRIKVNASATAPVQGVFSFRRHGRRHLNSKMSSSRRNRLDRYAHVGPALSANLKKLGVMR